MDSPIRLIVYEIQIVTVRTTALNLRVNFWNRYQVLRNLSKNACYSPQRLLHHVHVQQKLASRSNSADSSFSLYLLLLAFSLFHFLSFSSFDGLLQYRYLRKFVRISFFFSFHTQRPLVLSDRYFPYSFSILYLKRNKMFLLFSFIAST